MATENLSNLQKVTQLVSSETKIQVQKFSFEVHAFYQYLVAAQIVIKD